MPLKGGMDQYPRRVKLCGIKNANIDVRENKSHYQRLRKAVCTVKAFLYMLLSVRVRFRKNRARSYNMII